MGIRTGSTGGVWEYVWEHIQAVRRRTYRQCVVVHVQYVSKKLPINGPFNGRPFYRERVVNGL